MTELDPELARLAARLRHIREQRGQTLDELAGLTGFSKAYLSRLESGERQPSAGAMVVLARAWGVTPGSLFDEGGGVSAERVRRSASVRWQGDRAGQGVISVGSGEVEGVYSAQLRDEGRGINPEELIGAAEAGCFTMTLARLLTENGHAPEVVDTDAGVHGEFTDHGFRIIRIELRTRAAAPGLTLHQLRELAGQARRTSTVSRILTGVEIGVEADLAT